MDSNKIFAREKKIVDENKEIINKIKNKTNKLIGSKQNGVGGNEGYLMINNKFIKNKDVFFELEGKENPNYPLSTFLAGKIKNIMENDLEFGSDELNETNLAHSEQIMIAYLMDMLKLKIDDEKINVKIFTFRSCCDICYKAIKKFNEKYKDKVSLEVIDFGYDENSVINGHRDYYKDSIFKNIENIDNLETLELFDKINDDRNIITFKSGATLIGNKEYTIESLKARTNDIEAIDSEEVKKKSKELETNIEEFIKELNNLKTEAEKLINKKNELEAIKDRLKEKLKPKDDKHKFSAWTLFSETMVDEEYNEIEKEIGSINSNIRKIKSKLETNKKEIEGLNMNLANIIKNATKNQEIMKRNLNMIEQTKRKFKEQSLGVIEHEIKNLKLEKYKYVNVNYSLNQKILSSMLDRAIKDANFPSTIPSHSLP